MLSVVPPDRPQKVAHGSASGNAHEIIYGCRVAGNPTAYIECINYARDLLTRKENLPGEGEVVGEGRGV